ncbi:MAG: PD40 domain-containing protein [Kiritimatiellae bacterium]|nr:PD40 domain-containing protein [Kiritimatiellia bacterium]MBR5591365.1 PD40 domain-containing protein [Kiritimatiellia bacterium]
MNSFNTTTCALLATVFSTSVLLAADPATPATEQVAQITSAVTTQWPCQPEPVKLPHGFDPNRIYLGARPSLLPDGSKFLFEWCDAIWIAPTQGGTAKVLQHTTGRDTWPIVSNDGKRFCFQSNRSGGWHVFVADIKEGAEARQVGFNSEAERPYGWSNDDSELLCFVVRDDEGSVFDVGRLAWIPVNERAAERRIFDAPGSEPSLSPDGRYLLFTQEGEDLYRKGTTGENVSRIWCYDTQTGGFTLVVKHDTESRTPIWAPDGQGFYYVGGQDGTLNIWYHAFPGTEERQITFFRGDSIIHPTLSKDGKTMVFRQGFDFWSINPEEGGTPQRILLTPEDTGLARAKTRRRHYDTIWNNDRAGGLTATSGGLELAFTTGGDLYVMDTVLREPHLVYGSSRTHERDCVFSKDGSRLYFLSDRGDSIALLMAEKVRPQHFWWENSEFKIRELAGGSARRSLLSLSPDGTKLAWVEAGSSLVIADTEGNVLRRLPPQKSINSYDWSPDGRWMVTAMEDDYANNDIWLVPLEEFPGAKLYNVSRSFTWDGSPSWSPDGKLLVWNGQRVGSGSALFYVWLNRSDEESLKTEAYRKAIEHMGLRLQDRPEATAVLLGSTAVATPDPHSPNADADILAKKQEGNYVVVDLDGLHERVHATPIPALGNPCFAPNSRRILFPATINGRPGTYEVTIPNNMTPTFLRDRWGYPLGWFGRDKDPLRADKLLMLTADYKIGTLDETYPFMVYQEMNLQDYHELGFMMAWGLLRDNYYDSNFHGADWNAIRDKYQAPARFAPSRSVYERIFNALNGELNSSHLGFYGNATSNKEWGADKPFNSWEPVTSHLGIIFDQAYSGEQGWMVKKVIPGGPADSEQINIRPGDLIVSIDGKPIRNGIDPTLLLNGPKPGKFILEVRSNDRVRKVYLEAITYADARTLVQKAMYANRRDYVHRRSGGAFGYINIAQMNNDEYNRFEREIFAEGFDKDGMVIDVRDNVGGFTADKVLNILGVQRHSWSVARYGRPAYLASYWGRPVFDKPIVVLCNQNTVSNGEIFSHAIKQLGRGKLVGVQTNGGVIATRDGPLLDLGNLRQAHYGWYTLDGTDMELHGALPDVIVANTPADTAAGRDPQLDAAIDTLQEEVSKAQENIKPFVPNTFQWNHRL